jgi:hypothetical protein
MQCDAGRGCVIDCPGGCVARWDDYNLCEKRCLTGVASAAPLALHEPFTLSVHGANGRQLALMFASYLPEDLQDELNAYRDTIDLELSDATIADLIQSLNGMMGGLLSR